MLVAALTIGACGPGGSPNDPTETDTGGETATTPTDGGDETGSGGTTAGSGGEEGFAERCLKFGTGPAGSAFVAELCVCRVESGGDPDIETCVENMTLGEQDGTCMCAYYADHPDGQAYVDCLIAADEKAATCVASSACDEDLVEACFETFGADNSACPPPAEATLEGLSAACPSG